MVSNKMMTERMNAIKTQMDLAILTNGEIAFEEVNPTTKELLQLAFYEPKLTVSIGACGTLCDGTCVTCEEHIKQLSEFFCMKILEEQEAKWDKEFDELSDQVELEVNGYCDCQECRGPNTDYYDWWDEEEEEEDEDDDVGLSWNESGYFD
jgi:hypothetical protein